MSHRYGRRTWSDRNRPRVLDVAPGLIHESGPVRGREWAPERVAVMAHWSVGPIPSRSVVTMLRELAAGGYDTVLVSAAEATGPISRVCAWAPGQPAMPETTTVLRRANVGYDFGSWAAVLEEFPGVRAAESGLLVNDSLIGPFAPLAPILAAAAAAETPVWGLSGSQQYRPHLQSFFLVFKDRILQTPALRDFWSGIRVETRKAKIVRYNELGLSEVLDLAGIPWRAMFEPSPGGDPNPTIGEWERLLGAGFPFIKRAAVWHSSEDPPPGARRRIEIPRGGKVDLADWEPDSLGIAQGPLSGGIVSRASERIDILGLSPSQRTGMR